MRVALVAATLLVAVLAGCSGKDKDGTDSLTYTCPGGKVISADDFADAENLTLEQLKTKCPASGTGSRTNTTTSLAPNVLPRLNLTISDDGGNVTNVTMLDGNLTFSAAGSMDPDGSITGIAVSVQDSNTTRTASLFDAATKSFKTATFNFDRAGPAKVTIAMVDDRAGFNVTNLQVFVNHPQPGLSGGTLNVPAGAVPGNTGTDPCNGADDRLVDSAYFKLISFTVVDNASFIEAIPGPNTRITICTPDGTAISDAKASGPITSTNTEMLPKPTGTTSYAIGAYVSSPGANTLVDVIVHYEPRAAPAAEA